MPVVDTDDHGGILALSVLMPCHNEAKKVERSLKGTVKTLRQHFNNPFEVLIVDDGSTDGTWRVANQVATQISEIQVMRVDNNGGKGNALRMAFNQARGAIICFLDGDLDIHPGHIVPFARSMEEGSADIIIGSKRHPNSRVDYPRSRRILSMAYQLLVRSLFGLSVRDTQVGIKVFRREVLEHAFPLGLVKRYAFDVELLVLAHRLGYRIEEAPIEMEFLKRFGEGVQLRAIGEMFLDTLGIFFRLYITKYYDRARFEGVFAGH